ncbi:MAG: aminotransferase class V-fold PLP-dependent enzyme [Kofleriaceae bacterium]|nr:aminotransferase class V-fold PLP-dependent enzyme [Kofleriaceae bacterium]
MNLTSPVSPIDHWALAPHVLHLNHGSFGGCPRVVLAAADACRARMEAAPMRFYVLEWQAELDRARAAVAAFVGANAEHLVFVPSSTTGVALALASAELAAGDEILTTSHAYRACMNQLVRLADSRGARITVVPITLPFDPDALVDATTRAITPRTRLALLDHITSPTALRLPVERLVPVLAARGIQVLVDGAHAPGQLALDVNALGATWYVGNHHKWLCAPKGSGFLASSSAGASRLRPLVTSHGATPTYGPPNRLHAELDWAGTHDPSPHLAVPTAIETIAAEGGGWPEVFARNHALALEVRDRLGGSLLAPDDAVGTMAAVPLALPTGVAPLALERQLLERGIEVPIVDYPGQPLVRVSAHLYNHAGEADLLVRELHALGARIV